MTAVLRTLGELAQLCGGQLIRANPALVVQGISPLEEAQPHQLAFYTNPAYRKQLPGCQAAAIITSATDAELPELASRAVLVAPVPYAAFARIATAFLPTPAMKPGIDASARVDEGAEVDASARIEPFVHVAAGARIGPRAVIMTGSFVGAGASIGADTVLWPRVTVRDHCIVGERCILHPGVVIGADGFGFAFDPEGDGAGPMHRKVPQVGIVRLEDDVEIGANSCVDRATLGETVIGRGTKIDNLVQIAHNVQIGPLCVIAAQTGIAGSTTIGAGVAMGGQSGVVGHIQIGDMARIGAQAGVRQSVRPGESVVGDPAIEHKTWLRVAAVIPRLPALLREVRQLARRLTALEQRTEAGQRAPER